MLSTGMTRPVDELGRVVLPKELRYSIGIGIKDSLEIFTEDDMIILKPYEPGCCLCGEVTSDYISFKGNKVCQSCRDELRGR